MAQEQREDDDTTRGVESNLVQRIQRAWRETVGNYATEELPTKNLVQRLVDFGELSRDEAAHVLVGFKSRIEENRKELDRRVDESLKRATSRFTVPSPAELEQMRAQVRELEERLADVERRTHR
jgi:polyhydroxyalkanoate synthesis regulator phasin